MREGETVRARGMRRERAVHRKIQKNSRCGEGWFLLLVWGDTAYRLHARFFIIVLHFFKAYFALF